MKVDGNRERSHISDRDVVCADASVKQSRAYPSSECDSQAEHQLDRSQRTTRPDADHAITHPPGPTVVQADTIGTIPPHPWHKQVATCCEAGGSVLLRAGLAAH